MLEHPADSKAWEAFGLTRPERHKGWTRADDFGMTCYVEQCHYGHFSRKPTWLYTVRVVRPELNWTRGEQRLPEYAVERHGYAKARRIGVMAAIGGKHKTAVRNRTPEKFRDLLLDLARSVPA